MFLLAFLLIVAHESIMQISFLPFLLISYCRNSKLILAMLLDSLSFSLAARIWEWHSITSTKLKLLSYYFPSPFSPSNQTQVVLHQVLFAADFSLSFSSCAFFAASKIADLHIQILFAALHWVYLTLQAASPHPLTFIHFF